MTIKLRLCISRSMMVLSAKKNIKNEVSHVPYCWLHKLVHKILSLGRTLNLSSFYRYLIKAYYYSSQLKISVSPGRPRQSVLFCSFVRVWVHLANLTLGLMSNPLIIHLLFKRRFGGKYCCDTE